MHGKRKNPATVVIYLISAIVVPVALTLHSVVEPATLVPASDNPTPLGYTISLSLFVFPMLAIGWWFLRHPCVQFKKQAFLWALAFLTPLGFCLDFLFGNTFFVFPNHHAVTGITLPAVGGPLPIEEFIFYVAGFITVLLVYVWCDEYWLERYNVPDYEGESRHVDRLLRFHPKSLVIAAALITLVIVYKLVYSGEAGFPWYFIYLTLVALLPSMGFFDSAKRFINWRAFSFTFFIIVLISLLWEVTLALPYQWWGFQHHAMAGIYIDAWHGLPIEEVVVWFSVTYATVVIFEVIKIWLASNKPARRAFLGS